MEKEPAKASIKITKQPEVTTQTDTLQPGDSPPPFAIAKIAKLPLLTAPPSEAIRTPLPQIPQIPQLPQLPKLGAPPIEAIRRPTAILRKDKDKVKKVVNISSNGDTEDENTPSSKLSLFYPSLLESHVAELRNLIPIPKDSHFAKETNNALIAYGFLKEGQERKVQIISLAEFITSKDKNKLSALQGDLIKISKLLQKNPNLFYKAIKALLKQNVTAHELILKLANNNRKDLIEVWSVAEKKWKKFTDKFNTVRTNLNELKENYTKLQAAKAMNKQDIKVLSNEYNVLQKSLNELKKECNAAKQERD